MKNLSAFPRFPLLEALMILITIVVCLAGFTKAEVQTNYKKEGPSQQPNKNYFLKESPFQENPLYAHQTSEMKGHELKGKNFNNINNFRDYTFIRPIKRQSDYFGEPDDSDSEKESDGYGYDDDEYYHFNYKRNDVVPNEKADGERTLKEILNDVKDKSLKNDQNSKNGKENQEYQTIEMINFKEIHPLLSKEDAEKNNVKTNLDNISQKLPSKSITPSLRGIDFKENSALDDSIKDRKEESGVLTSGPKMVDGKNDVKATGDKDTSKLKDSKLGDDSEKKEKDPGLKDDKESVVGKTLKDSSKSSEDKEKTVKLSDNAKLKENIEKISSKSKDSENSKLTKEDKDIARFADKMNSEGFNENGLSDISTGASFVSNDYKDNIDALKSLPSQEDQKNSEEPQESERSIGLSEYQEDIKQTQDKYKEKQYNQKGKSYEYSNGQVGLMKLLQGQGKSNSYAKPTTYEFQNPNNFFKKAPWKDGLKMQTKMFQDFQIQPQSMKNDQMQQNDFNLDPTMRHTLMNMPQTDLENSEYHKNYVKSLKKYKSQSESTKTTNPDQGSYISSKGTNLEQNDQKMKKRSKSKKRRSMMLKKNFPAEDKSQNEQRNSYSGDESFSEQCLKKPHNSQPMENIKGDKKLVDNKKYYEQWDSNRQRRKSPQKLEYEIKVFNQNQQPDSKNSRYSYYSSDRFKKEVKPKLSNADKYSKKYPYSQVSRDDLTRLALIEELENEKKYKRKAPLWKNDDQKSVIQTRAAPSGYYSNRVKFGQKSFNKNTEMLPGAATDEANRLQPSYFSQTHSNPSKNFIQKSWDVKLPSYKHEPSKRYGDNKYLDMYNTGNSLVLLKKGERISKVFQEGTQPKLPNSDLDQDQLAKILEDEKNYLVFKKADMNKLQKNSDNEPSSMILQLDEDKKNEQKNSENQLWKELAAASEKIYRLRREGMEAGKLRKTIEDALSFKEVPEFVQSKEYSYLNGENINKYNPGSVAMKSDDESSIAEDGKNLLSQLEEIGDAKEGSELEKSPKSNYENHLSELFENLSANKNQKNFNENTWNKRKRKDTSRRKRFSKRDVSNKVSKTEVQNTVLKSLAEDNYRSVYSSGIKRRLLSTNNEVEDADSYSNEQEHVNNINSQETQENCVKNANNKCMDPMIVKLFLTDDKEAEKNRARRSLTSGFHSNFKREIDLDESMPNDFQNFLVTSLGGVGSQKREVVKKGEALWEGKETTQDNYNQIVENGKDANEDSALEKREVSSKDSQKSQAYKNPMYFNNENQQTNLANINTMNRVDEKVRSDDGTFIKSKESPYAEEKLPTQIRIKITNASSKEKKSSKPIMDENETTSTDIENLPKEKEFFDKNKLNPILSRNPIKFRQHPGPTYSDHEFEEILSKTLSAKRKSYPYWHRDRKKKKSTAESTMKAPQDFNDVDRKAMKTLLRRYKMSQDADQTQKISLLDRLPQVETVYNPTQGGNKALIQSPRLTKTNNIKSKNPMGENLQSGEGSSFDEGFNKPYYKTTDIKSDKGIAKEFEDLDWKIYSGRINSEQDSISANAQNMKAQNSKTAISNSEAYSPFLDTYRQNPNNQKWFQSSVSGNLFQNPTSNIVNSHGLYDVMKLRQQIKNRNSLEKENPDMKTFSKPVFPNEEEVQDAIQKKTYFPLPNWLEEKNNNNFDYFMNKRPFGEMNENKNFDNTGMKNPNQNPKEFEIYKHADTGDGTYMKNLYEKQPTLDPPQNTDNNKEPDYLDTMSDDYSEAETVKEPQNLEDVYKSNFKTTGKIHENPSFHQNYNYKNLKNNYKNSEVEDDINDEEEEFDEEYEESAEDNNLEDYSHFGYKKDEPDLSKFRHGTPKFQDNYRASDTANSYYNQHSEPKLVFEINKFNPNSDRRSDLIVPVEEIRYDVNPVSGSDELLKKANEKANIFGKNLVKKLHGRVQDEVFNSVNKLQNENVSEKRNFEMGNKLSKRKLDSQGAIKPIQLSTPIGSRMFYAAKIEVDDQKDLYPSSKIHFDSKQKSRHAYYPTPQRNAFYAEFAGGENDFEHESELNGEHFNDNLVSLEKNYNSPVANPSEGKKESGNDDDLEDVEENLEEGGEDNVLENVIGKYIMRKRIKSSDINKASEDSLKVEEDKKLSEEVISKHKLRKRSVGFGEKPPKALKKRLSSGHLTENNFRKYHKKNLTKKRHISDMVATPFKITTLIDDERKEKAKEQIKRSALDLFRKITSKEKDNKKIDNVDGRSAGFEPLLSFNDKSKGFLKDSKDTASLQGKQLAKENSLTDTRNNPPELKAHPPNEGQRSRAQLIERKKGKIKESAEPEKMTSAAKGPWKVELNNEYMRLNQIKEKEPKVQKGSEKMPLKEQSGRYKAFLVISNKVDDRINPETFPSISEPFHAEIGETFRTSPDERRRITVNHVRKRSLESSVNRIKTNDDDSQKSGDQNMTESDVKNVKALNDIKNLPVGDSKSQTTHAVQRNAKKNRSFVTADEENKNSQSFSTENLINRKSVFPPSSDENIIRDSRHINEETSEYHSQRIVDAILSQVSENSKFKELIAPGLALRTSSYKEGVDSKSKPTNEMNFSEELQSFLQKFMFDFENLARQHVKKRMCNKIDNDLKQFLQSLLSIPVTTEEGTNKRNCFTSFQLENTSENKNLSPNGQKSAKDIFLNAWSKKSNFLKTLVENYQNLSDEDKESINVNYPHLMLELIRAKEELGIPQNISYLDSNRADNEYNTTRTNYTTINSDFYNEKPETANETLIHSNTETIARTKIEEYPPSIKTESTFVSIEKPKYNEKNNVNRKNTLPVLFFNEIKNPYQIIQSTTPSPFESIISVNAAAEDANIGNKNEIQNEPKSPEKTSNVPNSTVKADTESPANAPESNVSSEKKKILEENEKKKEMKNIPYVKLLESESVGHENEAGLQEKTQDQELGVSNLKIPENLMNLLGKKETKTTIPQPEGGKELLEKEGEDIPSFENFRKPRELAKSLKTEFLGFRNVEYFRVSPHCGSHFMWNLRKSFFLPKCRPFYPVNKHILRNQRHNYRLCPFKRINTASNIIGDRYIQRNELDSNILKRKILKKRKSVVPRFLTRHSKVV